MSELLWHPIPGRLQSVSVADKAHIWGVTLDLQLAKFNNTTQQWQLVSVMTEQANQNRYSSSSAHSANTFGSTTSASTTGSVSGRASKTIAALLPSFGMGSSSSSTSLIVNVGSRSRPTSANTSGAPSPAFDGSFLSPRTGEEDEDTDSTVQVSAAADGTVVRLDKTLKAWYLIAPQNSEEGVDFGRDVIWIELGHFWKCVSVASISQIWGLSDCGDIYYGSSDRFVQLEAAVTSGAGYGQPQFTHISVGLDNTVLATDAHTGTVFRLKKADKNTQLQSHPPLWTALPGTGPHGLHITNCSLSTSDFIVGISKDGRCYRFCTGRWIAMGGGAKLDNVGVGADGYVIGVDRDGDLFGFQLEKIVIPTRAPKAIATEVKIGDDNSYFNNKQEYEAMEMPKTPTQQKSFSRRPMASPRELFEMAAGDRGNSSEKLVLGGAAAATAAIAAGRTSMGASYTPKGNAYSRYTMARSDSTLSKRSYASDIGSGRTTPTGLNIIQQQPIPQEPSPQVPEETAGGSSSSDSLEMLSPYPKSPLRIHTKRTGDSYFEPQSVIEHLKSPASGFPIDGNPYTATRSLASSQNNTRNPSPASTSQTPIASNSTINSSSLSNDLTKVLSPSNMDHSKQELSDSDDSVDLTKVQRIHALAMARKGGEEQNLVNNQLDTGSAQQGNPSKPLTPPPEDHTRSSEQEEGPREKQEVLSMLPTETEKPRRDLFVVTRFDTEQGINVISGGERDGHDAQENHVDIHLHTPPMTTPEEDKRQPFATSSKEIGLLSGGEGSSSVDKSGEAFGEGRRRGDSLRVEMNLVDLVAGEKHPVEYKRRPFRLSVDEGSSAPAHHQQPSPQTSSPQPYPIFSSTFFPEKEKAYDSIPTEPKHLFKQEDHTRYYPAPGLSSHRSSSSSQELMQQQQDFLRLARLRSESFQNSISNTNNSCIGKSEVFENIKEEAPSSPIHLQSFSLASKSELDPYSEHPLFYPGQRQFYQQESKQEYHPFVSTLASPSTNYNINNHNMSVDPMTHQTTLQVTSPPQQQEQLPLQERMQQLQQTQMQQQQPPPPRPQQSIPAYLPPQQGRDKDKDTDTEAASRPSYSSSHLQHYVDTTMVYQSGLASAERRQSQQYQLRQRNGVGGQMSQGGIQGEDADGRWIGGADPSEVRRWNPDDVHKNKCCTIL